MTYPSLSRRVRAIREAAGHRASLLEEPVVIDGLTVGVTLIFEKFTLRHLTGVPGRDATAAADEAATGDTGRDTARDTARHATRDAARDSAQHGSPTPNASTSPHVSISSYDEASSHESEASHASAASHATAARHVSMAPHASAPPPLDANPHAHAAALVTQAAEVRRFAYDELKSCRVTANGTQPPHLLVESRDRRRVATALRDADVPRVQAVLETIEHQIPETPVQGYIDYRVLALIGLCLALISGPSWALVFIAGLALAFPTHDLMLATVVMAIASGLLGVLNPAGQANVLSVMIPGAVAVAGVLMLAILMVPRLRARAARGGNDGARVGARVRRARRRDRVGNRRPAVGWRRAAPRAACPHVDRGRHAAARRRGDVRALARASSSGVRGGVPARRHRARRDDAAGVPERHHSRSAAAPKCPNCRACRRS